MGTAELHASVQRLPLQETVCRCIFRAAHVQIAFRVQKEMQAATREEEEKGKNIQEGTEEEEG